MLSPSQGGRQDRHEVDNIFKSYRLAAFIIAIHSIMFSLWASGLVRRHGQTMFGSIFWMRFLQVRLNDYVKNLSQEQTYSIILTASLCSNHSSWMPVWLSKNALHFAMPSTVLSYVWISKSYLISWQGNENSIGICSNLSNPVCLLAVSVGRCASTGRCQIKSVTYYVPRTALYKYCKMESSDKTNKT